MKQAPIVSQHDLTRLPLWRGGVTIEQLFATA